MGFTGKLEQTTFNYWLIAFYILWPTVSNVILFVIKQYIPLKYKSRFDKDLQERKQILDEKMINIKHGLENYALKVQTVFKSRIDIYPELLKRIKMIHGAFVSTYDTGRKFYCKNFKDLEKQELNNIIEHFKKNMTENLTNQVVFSEKEIKRILSHHDTLEEEEFNLKFKDFLYSLNRAVLDDRLQNFIEYLLLNSLFISDQVYQKSHIIIWNIRYWCDKINTSTNPMETGRVFLPVFSTLYENNPWFSTRNDGLKYNYNEEMFA